MGGEEPGEVPDMGEVPDIGEVPDTGEVPDSTTDESEDEGTEIEPACTSSVEATGEASASLPPLASSRGWDPFGAEPLMGGVLWGNRS